MSWWRMKRLGLGPQHVAHLALRPDEELALLALGIGVGGRVERAFGRGHLAQHVVQGLAQHPGEVGPAGHLPGLGVGHRQQGVVVQHLLEVGDQPALVGRVAVEAAADLVVHAPGGHLLQRARWPCAGSGRRRCGGGGAAAGAPECWMGTWAPGAGRRVRDRRCGRRSPPPAGWARGSGSKLPAPAPRAAPSICCFTASVSWPVACFTRSGSSIVGAADLLQQRQESEARAAGAVAGREVGASEERRPIGRQPDAHGPAALPGQRLHGAHVDGVDVGAFLAVDLHRDVVLVQEGGDVLVLEGLALHHVAPVAGGIPDRQEHRAAQAARVRERLVAPRVPVHRVVRVLQQVGAAFQDQPVGVRGRAARLQVVRARLVRRTLGGQRLLQALRHRRRHSRFTG